MSLKEILEGNWDKSSFMKISLNENIRTQIENDTQFLNSYYVKIPLRTRAYVIINSIDSTSIPKCKCGCGKPCAIVSYADRRYSNGNVYSKNKFEVIRINSPSYYYVDKNYMKRYNRMMFQKKLIGAYDCTEYEKAKEMGFNKIYDCGTICYGLNF